MAKSIKEMWASYHQKTTPKHASENQIRDLHCAFMGGAVAMLTEMCHEVPKLPEGKGVDQIDSYFKEAAQFLVDLLVEKIENM